MSNYLNPENGFFSMMSNIFDLIILNLIYVLMNLPFAILFYMNVSILFSDTPTYDPRLIIGALIAGFVLVPSTTALYYAVVKAVRRHRGYPVREFFRSFKLNFKQGVGASYIFLLIGSLLVVDFWYAKAVIDNGGSNSMLFGFIIIAFFLVSTFLYYCPVLSRFSMKQLNAIKFSIGLAARHIGYTLLFILIWLVFAVLGYYTNGLTVFLLLSACVLGQSFMMEKILKKYVLKAMEHQNEGSVEGDETASDGPEFNFKRLDAEEAGNENAVGKKKKNTASDDEWYLE